MFAWLTVSHLLTLLIISFAWRADSHRKLVLTPFVTYVFLDLVFSWNYWLLFSEFDFIITPSIVLISLLATLCFTAGSLISCGGGLRSERADNARALSNFLIKPVVLSAPKWKYKRAAMVLLVGGVALSSFYYRGEPPSFKAAVRFAVGGDLSEAHSILSSGRRELTKAHVFEGEYRGQGFVKRLMRAVWTYGLTMSVLIGMAQRSTFWLISVGFFFCGVCYYVGGTGERAPLLFSFLAVLISISYVRKLKYRHILGWGLALLLLLISVSLLMPRFKAVSRTRTEVASSLVTSVARRIMAGNKINNVLIMKYVEEGSLGYTYGREHLNFLINAIPGIHKAPLANELASMEKGMTTTYFSGTYLGKVYLDFGVIGVLSIYSALGFVLQETHRRFLKCRKTVENVAFLGLLNLGLGMMSFSAGLIGLLTGMVPVLVVHYITTLCLGKRAGLRSGGRIVGTRAGRGYGRWRLHERAVDYGANGKVV